MNLLKRALFDLIFYGLGASKEQLDHYHDHINPETRRRQDPSSPVSASKEGRQK